MVNTHFIAFPFMMKMEKKHNIINILMEFILINGISYLVQSISQMGSIILILTMTILNQLRVNFNTLILFVQVVIEPIYL